jgi:uncharacterized membrane protein
MNVDYLYDLSILTTGLFCGLMMTLVFVFQRQWDLLDDETYKNTFRIFLRTAKGHWLITILVVYSFIVPIVIGLKEIETTQGIVRLLAGIIFFTGCFVVTFLFNLPIYNTIINSSNEELKNPKEIKKRFYILNIIRFLSSLITSLLLIFGR